MIKIRDVGLLLKRSVLVIGGLLLMPTLSVAAGWVPFGTGTWTPGAGQTGGMALVVQSGPCTVDPGTCPYGQTDGGASFVPTTPIPVGDITSLGFVYKTNLSGVGGGSPRMTLTFSSGGRASALTPDGGNGAFVANTWTTLNALTEPAWDTSTPGNSDYFTNPGCYYHDSWAAIQNCFAGQTITKISLINDSAWAFTPDTLEIIFSSVDVNGVGLPKGATLNGFYPPVDKTSEATNVTKGGRAIPLKFYAESGGVPIADLTMADISLKLLDLSCADTSPTLDPIEEFAATGQSGLINKGGGYYQLNWKTLKTKTTVCRQVELMLQGGYVSNMLEANFKLTK